MNFHIEIPWIHYGKRCRLQDIDGVLQVYRSSGEERIIVDNGVGEVTYLTGKVALTSFNPVAIGSETTGNTTSMEVFATPSSSDILPLREQIILIESGDVNVTMLDDAEEPVRMLKVLYQLLMVQLSQLDIKKWP